MNRSLACSFSAIAGIAHALSIGNWWNGDTAWWLQPLSMALLAGQLLSAKRWQDGVLLGSAFATAWLSGTFWWLFIAMHTYGGLSAPLAALAVLALAAFLALYYAAACGAFVRLAHMNSAYAAIIFAACWTLAELAREVWFTGFPWGAAGYAHLDGPLAGYAPWVGVLGMGALAVALALWLAQAWRALMAVMPFGAFRADKAGGADGEVAPVMSVEPAKAVTAAATALSTAAATAASTTAAAAVAQRRSATLAALAATVEPRVAAGPAGFKAVLRVRTVSVASVAVPVLCAAVVLAAPFVLATWGQTFTRDAGSLQVALLQGNIPQDEKFEGGSGVPLALAWYAEQLAPATAPLVVAPETALPVLPQELPEGYLARLQARYTPSPNAASAPPSAPAVVAKPPSTPQAALVGIPLGNSREGYTNSVLGFKPGQAAPWRYDKHHLVLFGEVTPGIFKWFTRLMNIPLGDFNRGALGQPSFDWQGQRLALNICYEDLFGEELAVRFANAETAPTVFVNVSNLAWFGNSAALDQHLHISQMRALEFERPFLRATNTGATVIIDHHGTVQASLPRHTRAVLAGSVQGRSGITPYAWWASRFGLWPLWGVCFAVILIAVGVRSMRLGSQLSS